MGTYAKVIADSTIVDGPRLTTLEVCFHRFVLAEFNTHRVFTRSSASSRAIPVTRKIQSVLDDTAYPVELGKNKPGMQAGETFSDDEAAEIYRIWDKARDAAVKQTQKLVDMGVHKQIANRLLEPFSYHTVLVASTEWDNFFKQRCSPLAQPEIRVAAEMMRDAIEGSEPERLFPGDWHTPFITNEERKLFTLEAGLAISTARCARVSYEQHDGTRDPMKDVELFHRLVTADPKHYAPTEFCASVPMGGLYDGSVGNYSCWRQLRHDDAQMRLCVKFAEMCCAPPS